MIMKQAVHVKEIAEHGYREDPVETISASESDDQEVVSQQMFVSFRRSALCVLEVR